MADIRTSNPSGDNNPVDQGFGVGAKENVGERGMESSSPELSSNDASKVEKVKTEEQAKQKEDEAKKPSKLKAMWAKLDLDMGTLMMMFK